MSQFSIQTPNLYPSPIGSAPVRSNHTTSRSFRIRCVSAIVVCGIFFLIGLAFAGSLDSIPVGSSDRVILQQDLTLSENGGSSNLFVPQRSTVFFDFAVQPGKEVLLIVITEDQWQAMSAGEQPEGMPLLRTTVSGVGTQSIILDRGTYIVAFIPTYKGGSTSMTLRARGRY